nr:MAG TPA: major tail protein [Bacteriophage sp.]
MYDVTAYYKTGFDGINIPGNIQLLEQMEKNTFPAINVLQDRALASVTIRASKEQTENIDYVKIGSAYYFAVPHQSSPDVCVLSLDLDGLLTMGGAENVEILDGYTERHHVASDEFGAYREEDPMLSPNRPLEIVSAGILEPSGTGKDKTIVQSTCNLYVQGRKQGGVVYTGTDEGGQTISVTVPEVAGLKTVKHPDFTKCSVSIPGSNVVVVSELPGTQLYDGKNEDIIKGINRLRGLGQESCILNQYIIPDGYTTGDPDNTGTYDGISGKKSELQTALPFAYAAVKNQRLLYGANNDYVIISPASGNSAHFCPEDIYHTGDTAPAVSWFADPRPDGKPYYRFKYYRGTETNFLENCITGLTWQNAPLVYTDKSGNILDTFRFETDQSYTRRRAEINTGKTQRQIMRQGASLGGGLLQTVLGGNRTAGISGIGSALDFAADTATQYTGYEQEGVDKIADYGIEQTVVTPEIHFPRSESIRDFVGNGVMVYRLRYHPVDLTRLDKKLTMYGYRTTDVLEKSFFTNRQYFNFVQCSSVSLGGDFPMYIRERAAQQLTGGVRVWHVKPSASYYTSGNPVKA